MSRLKCLTWSVIVLISFVIALLYAKGTSGPELEPWHTEKLDAEFTTRKAGEIKSFSDYLQLEDELFAQLEAQVYAPTATGPDYGLVRYSAGSSADPQQRKPNWNRSFELSATAAIGGVLLLHGMSDSPYSFRALAETLNKQGYQVLGLRLPGHGTAPSGLTSVSWQDMVAAVHLAMQHLATTLDQQPIHIIGYSTGAPLALFYALDALEGKASAVPASLVLVSPAIGLSPAAALARWKRRMSYLPGLGRLAYLQIQPEFDPYKYNSFATNAAEQVHSLTSVVSTRIAARARTGPDTRFPPTLVLKSTVDATVSTNATVEQLLRPLGSNRNELVLFDINRFAMKSVLLVTDPGPLTARVMDDATLPFAVTLLGNENPQSSAIIARHKPPFSADVSTSEPLGLAWPQGLISLSHVALPFPPDDPLYGNIPPDNEDALFLGRIAIQGERNLMKISTDWLLRLRYNPFYDYLERRVIEWVNVASGQPANSGLQNTLIVD